MWFLEEIFRELPVIPVYKWHDDRPNRDETRFRRLSTNGKTIRLKYIRKICQGVVIYKKPHAEERKGFAPVHLNRRLCTLRVTKGMKK